MTQEHRMTSLTDRQAEILAFIDAPSKRGLIRAAGVGAEHDEG